MIKQMEMEFMFMQMEQNIKELGKMINSMATEQKFGLMEQSMKASMKMDINKAKGFLYGLINLGMKVNLKIIKWMEMDLFNGRMEQSIQDNGRKE